MLKIDCEGCEFSSLPPFLENVCVDQLILELHAYPAKWGSPATAKRPTTNGYAPLAAFFAKLAASYVPFYGEY